MRTITVVALADDAIAPLLYTVKIAGADNALLAQQILERVARQRHLDTGRSQQEYIDTMTIQFAFYGNITPDLDWRS